MSRLCQGRFLWQVPDLLWPLLAFKVSEDSDGYYTGIEFKIRIIHDDFYITVKLLNKLRWVVLQKIRCVEWLIFLFIYTINAKIYKFQCIYACFNS